MQENYHIMVVDDDVDDQLLLCNAFQHLIRKIKITSIYSGAKLLEYFADSDPHLNSEDIPDAIILDINMPNMTGLEVLAKIKKLDKCANIPVFMLSTLRTIERVDTSKKLGALKYYSKPNQLKDYSPICSEILENSIFKQ